MSKKKEKNLTKKMKRSTSVIIFLGAIIILIIALIGYHFIANI